MKQERFQELTGIQSGNFSVLTSINTRVQCHSRSISLSPGVQFHLSFHRSTDQGRQARSDDYSFANQRKVSSSLSLSLFRSSKRTDGSISLFVANELVRLPWVQNPLANPVDETRRQGYSGTPRCYHSSRRVSVISFSLLQISCTGTALPSITLVPRWRYWTLPGAR